MSNELLPEELFLRICDCRNIAVVVIDEAEDVIPLAHALLAGGVSAMELTFRTPCAPDALRLVAKEVPEMLVSAGTVLSAAQLHAAKAANAAFAVAPGFNPLVVQEAIDCGFPFVPGVMTPSEIEGAYSLGCNRLLKFFPASVAGGLAGLRTLAAPYRHLGLRFLPLGGLKKDNTGEWLKEPLVAACGGSWIAPQKLIQQKDWAAITENAKAATALSGASNAPKS